MSAAVYTQTTDVEVEVNGLMTYDREVIKFDVKETAAWHKALFAPPPESRTLVETSAKVAQKWRYTITKPGDDWFKAEYDDNDWAVGEGGFGTKGTPGAVVRTEWKNGRHLDSPVVRAASGTRRRGVVCLHHDEDVTRAIR